MTSIAGSPLSAHGRSARRDAPALVPAVSRALTVMDWISQQRQPMSLSRLSSELGLPKSSVHGLCHTLASFGYLRRQADGSFHIGPRVMSLAEAFVAGTDVAREFSALWEEADSPPDETMLLAVLSGAEVVTIAVRSGARPLGPDFHVGLRLPAHLAATGRAMLAWHETEVVRSLFPQRQLPRLTASGPATVAELVADLAQVRRRGHSVDDEAVREGIYSLGAAVFDASGRPVAGVGLCASKATLGAARRTALRRAVVDIAQRLSRRLGGEAPATGSPGRMTAP